MSPRDQAIERIRSGLQQVEPVPGGVRITYRVHSIDADHLLAAYDECLARLKHLAEVERQRDTLLKVMAEKDDLLDCYRKGIERSATIEPRPWWSVFGLDRILASRMHQQTPLLMDLALQHLVDEAIKRGVHPSEVRCAHREARAELMPEPKPAEGGAEPSAGGGA